MSQVFIEFTQVAPSSAGRDTPVANFSATVEEISSAAGQATTTATTNNGNRNVVSVMNNGTETIWVNFGVAAIVGSPSRPIAPNTQRDFGGMKDGLTVSVINDS